jgi:membrane protein YqaA with SNARE-associated domain
VPMALGARRRTARPFLAALAGMALGGSVTFLAASFAPHQTLSLLRHLPLVSNAQIGHARAQLLHDGVLTFWFQPWSGIPFKVWAVLAGGMHLDALLVIPTFIVARGLRMAVFATVAGLLSSRFTRFFRDFSLFLAVIYVAFFLYGWWQVMSMS